jgi:glycosyltransferase involved in cell wall biosynthesis
MPTVAQGEELVYIRVGGFSGSAISLRQAFRSRVKLVDFDLLQLARKPSLLPARARALLEARRAGAGVPWARTAAWSIANQRAVMRTGLITDSRPILFVQSIPAFVLAPTIRYGIYTDRVTREGAALGGVYASRFAPAWLEREEAFLRGAYRVYVMGPSTKDALTRDYGIPASRIAVVGAGPNMSLGQPVESESCRTILFVGTYWGLKGGPELLSAFAAVRKDFPDLGLLLVGSLPDGPLPEGVRAVGRVPHAQMESLYSQADALVIPSHIDAHPISFIEGLIKGLPCIGTTAGNASSIIQEAGECVEPGNVEALAAAMRRLITDYAVYRRRALRRGQQLRQSYRWENVASAMLEDLFQADQGRVRETG